MSFGLSISLVEISEIFDIFFVYLLIVQYGELLTFVRVPLFAISFHKSMQNYHQLAVQKIIKL